MIYYLVTREYSATINLYLEGKGNQLSGQITPLYYEDLIKRRSLPAGTYIFSDVERLLPEPAQNIAWLWADLAKSEHQCTLLNHPTRSFRRYELLRCLYERGINQFNIYRLTECRKPKSFPVFLRGENDHQGNTTGLLQTPEELDQAIQGMIQRGESREDCVITEFCDTRDDQGIFRKYSAFKIGNSIVPFHILFRKDWMIKGGNVYNPNCEQEEADYVMTNPHKSQLQEIFALANIDYGRIDYSLLNGVPQVWEINTNPNIRPCKLDLGWEKIEKALTAINPGKTSPTQIPLSVRERIAHRPYDKGIVDRVMDGFRWLPNQSRVSLSRQLRNFKKTLTKN